MTLKVSVGLATVLDNATIPDLLSLLGDVYSQLERKQAVGKYNTVVETAINFLYNARSLIQGEYDKDRYGVGPLALNECERALVRNNSSGVYAIKAMRDRIPGLGLKEAKDLCDAYKATL